MIQFGRGTGFTDLRFCRHGWDIERRTYGLITVQAVLWQISVMGQMETQPHSVHGMVSIGVQNRHAAQGQQHTFSPFVFWMSARHTGNGMMHQLYRVRSSVLLV